MKKALIYVVVDRSLFRPTDLSISLAKPTKALHRLNWQAHTKLPELINRLLAG